MSEVFYSLVVTTGAGVILSIAKLCFKSKCSEVDLCCIKIVRDVKVEEQEQEFIAAHKPISESDSSDKL